MSHSSSSQNPTSDENETEQMEKNEWFLHQLRLAQERDHPALISEAEDESDYAEKLEAHFWEQSYILARQWEEIKKKKEKAVIS